MSVDKEIRKANSERIIPVMELLIGDRTVREVERVAGIGNGIIGKIMRGERFPSSLAIKKLTSPEANPQNGITYEMLMIAAGYMLPHNGYDIETAEGTIIEVIQPSAERKMERLIEIRKKLHHIEVDRTIERIVNSIKENSKEDIPEETLRQMAYREYSYVCCNGKSFSEEEINQIAKEALEDRYE